MTYQRPMLPTQEQFTKWDSEYFDGERQNFDIMMMTAFQAGADRQLDRCTEELNQMLYVFELAGKMEEADRIGLLHVFMEAMRPPED
jgi:hypothetical protein